VSAVLEGVKVTPDVRVSRVVAGVSGATGGTVTSLNPLFREVCACVG
jgi:hypothetical protein